MAIGLLALGWFLSWAAYVSWGKPRTIVVHGKAHTIPPPNGRAMLSAGMLYICAVCTLWAGTEWIYNPYRYLPGDCERADRTAMWVCVAPVNKVWLDAAGVYEHTVCELQPTSAGLRWVCGAR